MSIKLSDEQILYLQASGKVILNACPGSGKTTTVAHKMYSLIQSWENNFSITAGIACLSFTNVAKNEISEKFKEINDFALPYPHLISTIDSFVNTYITLPFAHNLKNIGKRYRIIDDMNYLKGIFMANWQLKSEYGTLLHKFDPSKIDYSITNGIVWDGHDKSNDPHFVKYGKAVKKLQFSYGLLKTSDSAFFAFHILKKYPRLAKYIAAKFSYLMIDEAQDTSEIQHSILEMLYNGGLKNIDLVGDPYQCLYQWRDASPELFLQKFDDIENWKGLYLTENRRSTKKIVDVFSLFRRNTDKEIIPIIDTEADLTLHIIKYDSSNYLDAINKYERLCTDKNFTSNNVLVRGNTLKNALLGKESNYSPWNSSQPYHLIQSRIHLQSNEIKDAIKKVRRILIELCSPDISFADLKEMEQELKNDKDTNAIIFNLIRGLPSFNLTLKNWTIQTQKYLKIVLKLDYEPDFKIRKKTTTNFDKSTLDHPVKKYFKKAVADNKTPVSTVHQVKGMTFDSVFFILSQNSRGQNVSLKDFDLKESMPTEKQRLIYVGISRPRHLLCIGVPITTTDEELYNKFSTKIIIL